ncbi:MAG TPA: metallophosphoesterase family protein [Candidatus Sumerlaeota bacterium]|nr:metallophosphoesterase family protein [Candidatus Sumerlaeota bacterium]
MGTLFLLQAGSGLARGQQTASILKGPYLIYPGEPNKMTVLWQLDAPAVGVVDWRLESGTTFKSAGVQTYQGDYQYQYTFTDLIPGERYYYRVRIGTLAATGTFCAAPAADATAIKLIAVCDTHTNVSNFDFVSSGMLNLFSQDIGYQTMLLLGGDLVDDGGKKVNWQDGFFPRDMTNILKLEASLPIQAARGNQERGGALFRTYFPYNYPASGFWRSFDYGPLHVTILDQYEAGWDVTTNTSTLSAAQMAWVEQDLKAATKPWKIVLLHWPGWTADITRNQEGIQQQIQPLCERYGVVAVVGGHNHWYTRASVNGVQHISTGGGGADLRSLPADWKSAPYMVAAASKLHFSKIAIDAQGFHFEAVEPAGNPIESFTIAAPPTPKIPTPSWMRIY